MFPICIRSHWILAVAEIKYKNVRGENVPKHVDIKIVDSLELSERSEEVFSVLKKFYVTKIENDYKVTLGSRAIKCHVDKKLIQPNGHDCGPFIIYNFWKFIQANDFTSNGHIPSNIQKIGPFIRILIFRNRELSDMIQ